MFWIFFTVKIEVVLLRLNKNHPGNFSDFRDGCFKAYGAQYRKIAAIFPASFRASTSVITFTSEFF
jgi:hypothetical protein